MPIFTMEQLTTIASNIFEAIGTPSHEAKVVAEHLARANLYGVDSHGIIRILQYVNLIKRGKIKPGARIQVVEKTVSTAIVDGNHNFGQVSGKKAMEIAVKKAKSTGIGMVTLCNVYHTGRVGEYTEIALEYDMVGIAFGGGSKNPHVVAPGGITRVLGTNPIAISIPSCEERPFLLDMATSVVAGGKISYYLNEGKQVPDGWILDSEGGPTTNPADFRPPLKNMGEGMIMKKRGSLLPFGDYKGFNLGIFVQILGGFLAESGQSLRGGFIFIAIDIAKFRPVKDFKKNVDQLIRTIKNSKKRQGVKEILIAGDPELNIFEKRIKDGIYIGDKTWGEVREAAKIVGVEIESIKKG